MIFFLIDVTSRIIYHLQFLLYLYKPYFCSACCSSSMGTRTRRSPDEGDGSASSDPSPSTQVANPPRAATITANIQVKSKS